MLEADLRNSMKTRDIVVFEGHAGPFYGFSMANWNKTNEGDFDDSEMRDRRHRQQVSGRARRGLRDLSDR